MMKYRNWTQVEPSPEDWGARFAFVADDHDGAPDSSTTSRQVSGPTLDACLSQIDEIDDDPTDILIARLGILRNETLQLASIFRDAARALGVE